MRELLLLTLDDLPVPGHLLVQLLLQAAHQGVHHHVAILLDIELATQLSDLTLQLLRLLRARQVLILHKGAQLFIFSKKSFNSIILLSHSPTDLLDCLDHLSDLLLFICDMLLYRLQPAGLPLDNLVDLCGDGFDEGVVVGLRLVLLFVCKTSQLIYVHLLLI